MAARSVWLRPVSDSRLRPTRTPSRRSFFTLPTPPLPLSPASQTLTVSRILPYATRPLYGLIANIDAYACFLPYCVASRVTAWAPATASDTPTVPGAESRWPSRGALTVGWGPATVSYVSRVYCTPYSSVEAVSGAPTAAETAAGYRPDQDKHVGGPGTTGVEVEVDDGVFESLITRWDVTPADRTPGPAIPSQGGEERWSVVKLSIRYRFANPVYQLSASRLAGEVAGTMIEAFETRAKKMLGRHESRSGCNVRDE